MTLALEPLRARTLRRPAAAQWLMAVLALAAVVIVNISAARGKMAPVFMDDEVGYLSNSQVMAGFGPPRELNGSSYYLGWSLVLTPLWWILRDPDLVYRGAVFLSAGAAVALVLPLVLVARRIGLSLPAAVLAGSIVALLPARAVNSGFALSENMLALTLAVTAWSALRYASRPTLARATLLAALSAYAFSVHGRAVPVLIATGIWLGIDALRRVRGAFLALLLLGALTAAAYFGNRMVTVQLYSSTEREIGGLRKLLLADPLGVVVAAAGQLWFHVAATLGLVIAGFALVAMRATRELRRKHFSVGLWACLALTGTIWISITYISGDVAAGKDRLDLYMYSRYLEPFLPVIVLLGIAVLMSRASRRFRLRAALASAAVVVAYLPLGFAVLPRIDDSNGWWAPLNVAGLLHWAWPNVTAETTAPLLTASAAALAGIALWPLAHKLGGVLWLAFVAYFAVSGVVANERTIRPFYSHFNTDFVLPEVIERFPDETVSFDHAGLRIRVEGSAFGIDTVSQNAYQYQLIPRELPVFDSTVEDPETVLVIARSEWPRATELGARMLTRDPVFDNALWVLPGALQERLASAGELLPAPGGEAP